MNNDTTAFGTRARIQYKIFFVISIFYKVILCISEGIMRVLHEMYVLELIRFLKYVVNQLKAFVGSQEYLKSDRMKTETHTKIEALMELQALLNSTLNEARAEITINNVMCYIRIGDLQNPIPPENISYYVLLLHHEGTVHSTPMATPDKLGHLDFGGPYVFKNVTTAFRIKVHLYILNYNPISVKEIKGYFDRKPKMPMIKLIGNTAIDMKNTKHLAFTFRHLKGIRYSSGRMIPSIHIELKWPKEHKGFLIVGFIRPNRWVQFDKRWCVLSKYKLLYYATPSDEINGRLIATVSLKDCVSCEEINNIMSRKKSLKITLETMMSQSVVYVTPDTRDELYTWKEKIDFVVNTVANWKIKELF